jgi:hypothetical protein
MSHYFAHVPTDELVGVTSKIFLLLKVRFDESEARNQIQLLLWQDLFQNWKQTKNKKSGVKITDIVCTVLSYALANHLVRMP